MADRRARKPKPKLSFLIREGAKLRPACVGFTHRKIKGKWHSDAVGAALEAALGMNPENHTPFKNAAFILGVKIDIINQINRMTDQEGLSREEIANRLEAVGL